LIVQIVDDGLGFVVLAGVCWLDWGTSFLGRGASCPGGQQDRQEQGAYECQKGVCCDAGVGLEEKVRWGGMEEVLAGRDRPAGRDATCRIDGGVDAEDAMDERWEGRFGFGGCHSSRGKGKGQLGSGVSSLGPGQASLASIRVGRAAVRAGGQR
jgi:hypothetical protein